MERFKTIEEYNSALSKATMHLDEVRKAIPLYMEFFNRFESANENHFSARCLDDSAYRNITQVKNISIFGSLIKQWLELPFKESQKVWDEVKRHNRFLKENPKAYGTKFDTKKIYDTMKRLKEAKND